MLCSQEAITGYKIMWLYVMLDLPVETKKQRKRATLFQHIITLEVKLADGTSAGAKATKKNAP